mmetsp:Transcript_114418/g.363666  ORF Transcript_114418/g.363666 Transcript_114418/m.363666 type:complete len:298 (+) Transcript_114418:836-1729(+)
MSVTSAVCLRTTVAQVYAPAQSPVELAQTRAVLSAEADRTTSRRGCITTVVTFLVWPTIFATIFSFFASKRITWVSTPPVTMRVVIFVHIDAEDARGRGLVRGVRAHAGQPLDVRDRGQVWEVTLLTCLRQCLAALRHALQDVRRQADFCAVIVGGGDAGGQRAGVRELLLELLDLRPGGIALAQQACDDSARGVVLVQGVGQLLARGVEIRLQLVRLGHQSIPLALQEAQHARDGGGGRRPGSHCLVRLHADQVILCELLLCDRALSRALNVLQDEALLIDVPRLRVKLRLLRRLT